MQDRSIITINNILNAAQRLFTSRQYADVSIKDIAYEAGVTKGALYHHFSAKDDLYLKMMLRSLNELEKTTSSSARLTQGMPCRERLYHSLVGFLSLPDLTIDVIRLVRRDSNIFQPAIRQKLIKGYQKALPDILQSIISDGIEQGEIIRADARILAWQYIAIVEVSMHPYGWELFKTEAALADFIVTTFVNGLELKESSLV